MMSSGPDPTWTPPLQQPALLQQPAGHPAQSLKWRIMHSWWLLLPILGCACLGGAGFLYVGFRARRPAWWIPGLVYLAAGVTSFVLTDTPDKPTTAGAWAPGIVLAAWLASILHAFLINNEWLRWQATRVPWYQTLPGNAPVVAQPWQHAPAANTGLPPGLVPPVQQYYGQSPFDQAPPAAYPTPVVPAPPAMPYPTQPTAPQSNMPPPYGAVNVNTATAQQLAELPYIDPVRATRIIAERHARGRFATLDEFATAANLAPHEHAHLRQMLTTSAPAVPLAPPTPGRVLDV